MSDELSLMDEERPRDYDFLERIERLEQRVTKLECDRRNNKPIMVRVLRAPTPDVEPEKYDDKPERYPNPPSIEDRKRIQERENDQTRTTSR